MANQLPQATTSEVFSVARKVMDDAVAFYLANGGPAAARQHIEELACSLKFYPDSIEAYYDALAAINAAEKAEQLKAEEKAQQDQRNLLMKMMSTLNSEQQPAQPRRKEPAPGVLPKPLSTDKAMRIWQRLQQAGYIDDRYQPVGLSRTETAVLANKIARMLRVTNKWKTFETLWGKTCLRADYNRAMDVKKTRVFLKKISTLLADIQ